METALDTGLVLILGMKNIFEFVERSYFQHFGRTSESTRYEVGCFLGFGKLQYIFLKCAVQLF